MVFWLLLHFALGLAGTWLARRYALHRELIDHPGERRSHELPTPRGGGISIVVAMLVAACVLGWRNPRDVVLLGGYACGLVLIAGIGLADDHKPLSPWLRLAVQVVAAAILALAVAGTWGNPWLALLALVAALVLTNVWNFMDGINGLASSQALLVLAGISVLAGAVWGWLALAVAAACAGFLPLNFPKARIFLGDVGSGALGFTLAVLCVAAVAHAELPAQLLLLPLAPFLVDSGLTLLRRVLRRERWWDSHTQHAYQRWAARSGTHTIVTFAYAGWTVAGWLLAWGLAARPEGQRLAGCTLWMVGTAILWGAMQYFTVAASGPQAAAIQKDRE